MLTSHGRWISSASKQASGLIPQKNGQSRNRVYRVLDERGKVVSAELRGGPWGSVLSGICFSGEAEDEVFLVEGLNMSELAAEEHMVVRTLCPKQIQCETRGFTQVQHCDQGA